MKIHEIISDKLPHPTILKTSTCSASKIYPNVTLLGGIKSGNFTSLGKTKNMQECIGKTCELGSGDLAFMLGSYCYSVTCSSGRVCQTIPAQPSKFYPRIAFLKWAPKINETGIAVVNLYLLFFSVQCYTTEFPQQPRISLFCSVSGLPNSQCLKQSNAKLRQIIT